MLFTKATDQERFFKCKDYGLSLELAAGVLSMNGLSAYCGFLDCGKPNENDTVVVSAAAGGVGTTVCQIAKIYGCRVIGIAGSDRKCAFLSDLGCDAVVNYRTENLDDRLTTLCPDGLDIYFDNVGGDILSTCLEHLAFGARVVLCGSISEYLSGQPYGLTNYTRVRAVNGSINGFFVYNYCDRFYEACDQLAKWISQGLLRPVQDMVDGFEHLPHALARLYAGDNIGVQCCRVRSD